MKTLIAGIVLIVVLGVGGFFYRNVLEHPGAPVVSGTACTADAKLCPDGTAVGRSGPNCEFAVCPAPNVSVPGVDIAYAVPAGYQEVIGADTEGPDVIAKYIKGATSSPAATIGVFDVPLMGDTANSVILAGTLLEPSDMHPKDMSAYTPKIIGTRTFQEITTERFEGTVTTDYFLVRQNDVLGFEVVETGVTNWTDANLIPDNLPEHQALIKMLGTLEDQSPRPE